MLLLHLPGVVNNLKDWPEIKSRVQQQDHRFKCRSFKVAGHKIAGFRNLAVGVEDLSWEFGLSLGFLGFRVLGYRYRL